jgi:hypothetical protein
VELELEMEQQDLNLEEKVVEMVDLTAETANQELQTLEAVEADPEEDLRQEVADLVL